MQGGGKVRDPCVGWAGWLGRAQGWLGRALGAPRVDLGQLTSASWTKKRKVTSNPEVPGPSRSWSPAPSAPSSPLDLRTRLHRRGYLRRNVIGGAIRLHSGRCPPVAVALSAAEHQAMPGRPWPLQQPGQRPWQPLWPACHVQQPAWSSLCLGFECGCDSSPRALGMAGAESEGTPCTAGNGAFWTGFSQSHAGQFPSCDWAGGAGNRQLPMQRRVPSMSGNLRSTPRRAKIGRRMHF